MNSELVLYCKKINRLKTKNLKYNFNKRNLEIIKDLQN